MMDDPIVILSAVRSPIGNLLGELKDFSAHLLGSHIITAAVERAQLKKSDIQEIIMGCVLPAGQGQAPTRQAALHAGLPESTSCTTLNKVCGSGMKAVMFAHNLLQVGERDIVIAGGMESMTNAPYLLAKARQGYRLGKSEIYDHMMLDGLEDAYEHRPMGYYAEMCADKYDFTRKEQDDYATASFKRAQEATKNGAFSFEIVPLTIKTKKGDETVDRDEHPFSVNPEKIPQLSSVFKKDGTVTAGNSSSIADGSAALVLMRQSEANKRGLKPLAKIIGSASHSKAPAEFTTAPIDAAKKLFQKISWKVEDVDLFEVNEAFAVVAMTFMKELQVPHEKMNVHGGACALGHPIGASGARIIVTLIGALKENRLKRGMAALCIGGGEATAVAIEMM